MPSSFGSRVGTSTRLLLAALAAVPSVVCADTSPAPHRAVPHRIVSLNACADQYLIALADKDQIAALTQYARDTNLSFYADRARAYPTSQGQAEAVMALRPDLIIASPFRRAEVREMLRGQVRILSFKPADSFDAIVEETRAVALAVGHPERGEALIASMRARVNAAGKRPLGGVAAHYQRGGYMTGPGTLMDDLMTRAGLVNLARRLRGGAIGQLSLEQIVYQRPDFLVLTDASNVGQDEGSLTLDHPALVAAVPAARRLHVPTAFTVCGGPSYPDALERLQAEADRARGARR
jgi:iron complex transport system substrate-binding protein